MKTLVFFIALLKTSIKATVSTRAPFLIESGLMIINNMIFFAIWWIFFHRFPDINGWDLQDMIVLTSVSIGSYGLMQVSCGGIRNLARMIVSGNLDPFMTQPKNLLLHILGSRSMARGWGHLISAGILVTLGGILTLRTAPLICISILCGSLVFTAFNTIAHSLSFWLGFIEGLSKKYCDALLLFSAYPTNIYSGLLQVVMFTLIPAGVITYLPVELIRLFSWPQLLILIATSLTFLALALLVFHRGLKRYESGNTFGMRL